MKKSLVSNREFEVMNILWNSDVPLTAKQIHEANDDLVLSTVQSVIKKLLSKDLIEVADIVYSGTVLTRSYSSKVNEEDFVLMQYDDLNISKLISQFLGNSKDVEKEIEEIQSILEEKRRE